MNEIPAFEDALESFRRFLSESGKPTNICWVFREDIWKRSPTDVAVRLPSQTKNLVLAKKVFEEGREKGLVEVRAIATMHNRVAVTIWFPKFSGEEIQGWDRGMKLSIAEPLPRANIVRSIQWLLFRLRPPFGHYQRFELWVGTKPWAAAEQPISAWSGLAMSGFLGK
jgi:hypothetical protein